MLNTGEIIDTKVFNSIEENAMTIDAKGTIWLGRDDSLYTYTNNKLISFSDSTIIAITKINFTEGKPGQINNISFDYNEAVWLSGTNGIAYYADSIWTAFDIGNVNNIAFASTNQVWSCGDNLSYYSNGQWHLVEDSIYSDIYIDQSGCKWLLKENNIKSCNSDSSTFQINNLRCLFRY